VLPQALGGRLIVDFLCKGCNSKIGNSIERHAKADPTIRKLAIELSSTVPKLAERIAEGQKYVSTGPGPRLPGRIKDGEFLIDSATLVDGSVVQPGHLGIRSIEQRLKRKGVTGASAIEAIKIFKSAPENTKITLSEGLEVINWQVTGLQPLMDGPDLNLLVPLKIAFEFLAIHLGTAIYKDSPSVDAARESLFDGVLDSKFLLVERLHAPEAKPFHGIVFEGNAPYAKVVIRLFGQLAFRVHFLRLSVSGPRLKYTHELDTGKELLHKLSE
jgi:hypothetical protein